MVSPRGSGGRGCDEVLGQRPRRRDRGREGASGKCVAARRGPLSDAGRVGSGRAGRVVARQSGGRPPLRPRSSPGRRGDLVYVRFLGGRRLERADAAAEDAPRSQGGKGAVRGSFGDSGRLAATFGSGGPRLADQVRRTSGRLRAFARRQNRQPAVGQRVQPCFLEARSSQRRGQNDGGGAAPRSARGGGRRRRRIGGGRREDGRLGNGARRGRRPRPAHPHRQHRRQGPLHRPQNETSLIISPPRVSVVFFRSEDATKTPSLPPSLPPATPRSKKGTRGPIVILTTRAE
mmetsp:Transcript_107/g.272  ORF Transcript_107/g.272 Transcript_107/m.272 type:complete len:290 (-) Transcript_107:906-1775(-)